MKKTGRDHLEALGRSKSQMAEGQPNLQNWKVVDHTGQKVGTVYDLLFDKESKKVRYIVTNLKNGELLKEERLVPLPVGRARYRKSEEEIVFPNVTKDQISSLPGFLTVEDLTQEDEHAVRNAFRSGDESTISTGDIDRDTFYDHKDFDEDIFYNRNAAASRDTDLHTTQTAHRKEKPGSGTDTSLTGTEGTQNASENDQRKNEDVNVHPSPAERSADGLDSGNPGERKRDDRT